VASAYSEEFSITGNSSLTSSSGLSGILNGLEIGAAGNYTVGDVFVLNSVANGSKEITISGSTDPEWSESWPAGFSFSYGLNDSAKNSDVTFGAFYFDNTRNKTHAGEITVSFGDIKSPAAGASFTVAYPGKTAQASARLRDIDAFWNINGLPRDEQDNQRSREGIESARVDRSDAEQAGTRHQLSRDRVGKFRGGGKPDTRRRFRPRGNVVRQTSHLKPRRQRHIRAGEPDAGKHIVADGVKNNSYAYPCFPKHLRRIVEKNILQMNLFVGTVYSFGGV
jgi:hypothetical protein